MKTLSFNQNNEEFFFLPLIDLVEEDYSDLNQIGQPNPIKIDGNAENYYLISEFDLQPGDIIRKKASNKHLQIKLFRKINS